MHANHYNGKANKRYKLGIATEHTLIVDLQQLLEIKVPTSEPPMNQSDKLTKHLNILDHPPYKLEWFSILFHSFLLGFLGICEQNNFC